MLAFMFTVIFLYTKFYIIFKLLASQYNFTFNFIQCHVRRCEASKLNDSIELRIQGVAAHMATTVDLGKVVGETGPQGPQGDTGPSGSDATVQVKSNQPVMKNKDGDIYLSFDTKYLTTTALSALTINPSSLIKVYSHTVFDSEQFKPNSMYSYTITMDKLTNAFDSVTSILNVIPSYSTSYSYYRNLNFSYNVRTNSNSRISAVNIVLSNTSSNAITTSVTAFVVCATWNVNNTY